jgi:transposase
LKLSLTKKQKEQLECNHKHEHDSRVCDRIKAVLLRSEGWENNKIAQALRIHEETVRQHLNDWIQQEKLKPDNGGSVSKLTDQQTKEILEYLEKNTYTKAEDICKHIAKIYQVNYTVSGMTKWLQQHDFSYKKPKAVPAKADTEQQETFIEKYLQLVEETPKDEPIIFIDAVHPTMATKVSCGWIKKGTDKLIQQTASRTRVNIIGSIELSTMKTITNRPETVNGKTTIEFLKHLKLSYPSAKKLHVILDQSGYHRSELVQEFAKTEKIELHYLPPYSPNLNPIERLWKVMNEKIRNNHFFKSAKEFRDAITEFFEKILPEISYTLRNRINDNFQIVNPVSSG